MARGAAKPAEKPNLTYAEAKAKGLVLDYDVSYKGTRYLKEYETRLINAAGGQDAFRSQEWWEQQYDKDVSELQQSGLPGKAGGAIMQDLLKKAMESTSRTSKEELVRTQRDVARGQLATRRLFRGTGGLLSGGQAGTIAKEPTIGAIEAPMLSTSGKLAMENPLGAKRGLK